MAIFFEDLLLFFCYRTLSPYGWCEPYRGKACAEFIGNESVWVEFPGRQQLIERKLGVTLNVIKGTNQMSEKYVSVFPSPNQTRYQSTSHNKFLETSEASFNEVVQRRAVKCHNQTGKK